MKLEVELFQLFIDIMFLIPFNVSFIPLGHPECISRIYLFLLFFSIRFSISGTTHDFIVLPYFVVISPHFKILARTCNEVFSLCNNDYST